MSIISFTGPNNIPVLISDSLISGSVNEPALANPDRPLGISAVFPQPQREAAGHCRDGGALRQAVRQQRPFLGQLAAQSRSGSRGTHGGYLQNTYARSADRLNGRCGHGRERIRWRAHVEHGRGARRPKKWRRVGRTGRRRGRSLLVGGRPLRMSPIRWLYR